MEQLGRRRLHPEQSHRPTLRPGQAPHPHYGETSTVAVPFKLSHPPQGNPVIAQADSSGPGQDLGARIPDRMGDWFTARGCDGSNLMPDCMPGPASAALDHLILEQQRRGLAQTDYQGDGTFRSSPNLARRAHPET